MRKWIAAAAIVAAAPASATTVTYDWWASFGEGLQYHASITVEESAFKPYFLGGDISMWCICDWYPDHWSVAARESISIVSNLPEWNDLLFWLAVDEARDPWDWGLHTYADTWILDTGEGSAGLSRFGTDRFDLGVASLTRREIAPVPIPATGALLLGPAVAFLITSRLRSRRAART